MEFLVVRGQLYHSVKHSTLSWSEGLNVLMDQLRSGVERNYHIVDLKATPEVAMSDCTFLFDFRREKWLFWSGYLHISLQMSSADCAWTVWRVLSKKVPDLEFISLHWFLDILVVLEKFTSWVLLSVLILEKLAILIFSNKTFYMSDVRPTGACSASQIVSNSFPTSYNIPMKHLFAR